MFVPACVRLYTINQFHSWLHLAATEDSFIHSTVVIEEAYPYGQERGPQLVSRGLLEAKL